MEVAKPIGSRFAVDHVGRYGVQRRRFPVRIVARRIPWTPPRGAKQNDQYDQQNQQTRYHDIHLSVYHGGSKISVSIVRVLSYFVRRIARVYVKRMVAKRRTERQAIDMRISVVGVPGSGKTTLLETLRKQGEDVICEPIVEWSPWIEAYYRDPERHAFGFQTCVLQHFHAFASSTCGPGVYWFERSPEDSKAVFGSICKAFMTPFEDDLYAKLYRHMTWTPDLVVYLRVDVDVAWNRIERRARVSEYALDRTMVRSIHEAYEREYGSRAPSNLVVVDANEPIDAVLERVRCVVGEHVGPSIASERNPFRSNH